MILCAFCVLSGLVSRGVCDNTDDLEKLEPPVANQPSEFNGAIGSYAVSMQAAPTTVVAEDPIVLKVKIRSTGTGSVNLIRRPDLLRLPPFARQFKLENLGQRDLPGEKAREFTYRLRPLHVRVKQIPALPFVYFNPAIQPASRGYQRTYAAAIPIVVTARSSVAPAEIEGAAPPQVPHSAYTIATGPALLRNEAPFSLPGPAALVLLVCGPPLICVLSYAVWQRRYPDRARRTQQRRSRAASRAMHSLQILARNAERQPENTKEVVVSYLQERFDLGVLEPTPLEIVRHLERLGLAAALVQAAQTFFSACDAARFAPELPGGKLTWVTEGETLVRALEDQSWSSQAT